MHHFLWYVFLLIRIHALTHHMTCVHMQAHAPTRHTSAYLNTPVRCAHLRCTHTQASVPLTTIPTTHSVSVRWMEVIAYIHMSPVQQGTGMARVMLGAGHEYWFGVVFDWNILK